MASFEQLRLESGGLEHGLRKNYLGMLDGVGDQCLHKEHWTESRIDERVTADRLLNASWSIVIEGQRFCERRDGTKKGHQNQG